MRLVALREMYYASKTRWPGEEFECDEQDAKIFLAPDLPGGQKARKADDQATTTTQAVRPAAATPAPPPAPAPADSAPESAPESQSGPVGPMTTDSGLVPGARRRYNRRNMTSED